MGSGHSTGVTPGRDSITRKGSPSDPGVRVISSLSRETRGASGTRARTTVS